MSTKTPGHRRKNHFACHDTHRTACGRALDDPEVAGHTTTDTDQVTCTGCEHAIAGTLPQRRAPRIHLLSDGYPRAACGLRRTDPQIHPGANTTSDPEEATCRGCLDAITEAVVGSGTG